MEYMLLHWSGRDLSHKNAINIAGLTTYHNLQEVRNWVSERLEMIIALMEQTIEAQWDLDRVVTDFIIQPVTATKSIPLGLSLFQSFEGFVYAGTHEPALLESKLSLVITKDGATIWEDCQDHYTFAIELLEKPEYCEEE